MKMTTSRAPLIAAVVLLLLPVSYFGSYFALVLPSGFYARRGSQPYRCHYRLDLKGAERIYWPVERIDRRLRPAAWENPWEQAILQSSQIHRSRQARPGLGKPAAGANDSPTGPLTFSEPTDIQP